ncbi:MAG: hypothetical protein AAGF56_12680, partial [Pseudomonadota bacterium]
MRRAIETCVFATIALALHVAFFAVAPAGSAGGQGAAGQALIALQGATPQMAAMVRQWETPPDALETPDVAEPPPPLAPADLPEFATPQAPTVSRDLPIMLPPETPDAQVNDIIDTATVAPPERFAPTTSNRPQARPTPQPEPAPPPAAPQRASQQQNAAGTNGGSQAGRTHSPAAPSLSEARSADLRATWGAQIVRRVDRRARPPRAP